MKEVDVKKQTQRNMTNLKWTLLVFLQYEFIQITSPSIAGVTYMDKFDFEERYRDVNECNPFHWHPLHLPDYCGDMFEKLIRSRLASKTPVRIMREKEKPKKGKDNVYSMNPGLTGYFGNGEFPFPIYQMTSVEYESYDPPYGKPLPLSPYEKLLEMLKIDIKKGPSAPTVTVMPNLGPVALYKQAISKKSMHMIRQLSEAFVKATKKGYKDFYAAYPNFPTDKQVYVYDSAKNNTKAEKKKKKKDKGKKNEEENNNEDKEEDKSKVYKMKTKHGDVVTIVEAKNMELMQRDGIEAFIKMHQKKNKKNN